MSGETFTATVRIYCNTLPLGGYTIDVIYEPTIFTITDIEGISGLTVIIDKEFYSSGDSATIQTTIANEGIDIVEGNLSLKLVAGEGSITSHSWNSQSNFQEGTRTNTDTYFTPGQIKLLSMDDDFEQTYI